MFGFEKLDVWNRAIQFSSQIYDVTKLFPPDERFGLTNQLRRSSVSIAANIAEGSGRGSSKDFIRFINVAYGSLMETVSPLRLSKEQHFLGEDNYALLYREAESLARMLSGLRASLASSSSKTQP